MTRRGPSTRRTAREAVSKTARKTVTRRARRPNEADPSVDTSEQWRSAVTQISPNKILLRGYVLDELMGRISFGEAVHLILTGELPSRDVGRLVEAVLVSSIDHGVTPPSTLAARTVATTRVPMLPPPPDCLPSARR